MMILNEGNNPDHARALLLQLINEMCPEEYEWDTVIDAVGTYLGKATNGARISTTTGFHAFSGFGKSPTFRQWT